MYGEHQETLKYRWFYLHQELNSVAHPWGMEILTISGYGEYLRYSHGAGKYERVYRKPASGG